MNLKSLGQTARRLVLATGPGTFDRSCGDISHSVSSWLRTCQNQLHRARYACFL